MADVASAYGPADRARRLSERHENRQRSDFARDRARLLHSSALRRLAAKTQVLSPTTGIDFARNRLTHSLEVAQVGRELADSLGLEADIVDTACLAHDIGHPPFGHNGERALNEWAHQIGGFEGNAQTLRVLTRLEPKVIDDTGAPFGLNLTRASLDASCKYPWPSATAVTDPAARGKFGVYADDMAAFRWMRESAVEGVLCVEAQVMDLSDDIAYSVHDFEDAIVSGYIDVRALGARVDHNELVHAMYSWIGGEFSHAELEDAFDRLAALPMWLSDFDSTRGAQAALKNLTSQLIGRFASAATEATRATHDGRRLVRFDAHVVVPEGIRAEIAVLKGIVAAFVMSSDRRQPIYVQQREVLSELADALWDAGGAALDPLYAGDWRQASDDDARKRVIVDQIAGLTDQSALAWYEQHVKR